jgi:histidine triad (HIT) family protein
MTPPAAGDPCLFCAIGAGTVPASVVWRDQRVCAFLDARPVFKGHVLVVPRAHVPTLLDLPDDDTGVLFGAVRRIAAAVERALGADGTFVAMNNKVSQSVPHLHVHVVPRRRKDGLRGFFWPRVAYASDQEREQIAAQVATQIQAEFGAQGSVSGAVEPPIQR